MESELNRSQVFFPKLEALQFSGLKELREKMDARLEPDIDILMRSIGVPVTKDKFEIDDEIPIVENRKAVLYIREPKEYQGRVTLPKYHIVYCSTLRDMKDSGQYHRFHAADRTDGKFPIKLPNSNELSLCELDLCLNCLNCLNQLRKKYDWNVFPKNPKDFPLVDWLEPFFDYSSKEWKERSQTCREKANWTCQECNINLESKPNFLHAHHEWGTKFNDPEDLIALCIGCHAEQPGGGHRMLKYYPDYQEFMSKYGEEWRAYYNPF